MLTACHSQDPSSDVLVIITSCDVGTERVSWLDEFCPMGELDFGDLERGDRSRPWSQPASSLSSRLSRDTSLSNWFLGDRSRACLEESSPLTATERGLFTVEWPFSRNVSSRSELSSLTSMKLSLKWQIKKCYDYFTCWIALFLDRNINLVIMQQKYVIKDITLKILLLNSCINK